MKFHSTAINLQCKLLWRRMGEGEGNPTLHFLVTKSKPKEKQSCQEVDYYGVGCVCVFNLLNLKIPWTDALWPEVWSFFVIFPPNVTPSQILYAPNIYKLSRICYVQVSVFVVVSQAQNPNQD